MISTLLAYSAEQASKGGGSVSRVSMVSMSVFRFGHFGFWSVYASQYCCHDVSVSLFVPPVSMFSQCGFWSVCAYLSCCHAGTCCCADTMYCTLGSGTIYIFLLCVI
jgi:hypothetical protein